MKKNSNVISIKKNSSLIELPIVNLPFLEDARVLKMDKEELFGLVRHFSRNGRYPLPDGILSNEEIITFLGQNPTLVVRIRQEALARIDHLSSKAA